MEPSQKAQITEGKRSGKVAAKYAADAGVSIELFPDGFSLTRVAPFIGANDALLVGTKLKGENYEPRVLSFDGFNTLNVQTNGSPEDVVVILAKNISEYKDLGDVPRSSAKPESDSLLAKLFDLTRPFHPLNLGSCFHLIWRRKSFSFFQNKSFRDGISALYGQNSQPNSGKQQGTQKLVPFSDRNFLPRIEGQSNLERKPKGSGDAIKNSHDSRDQTMVNNLTVFDPPNQ